MFLVTSIHCMAHTVSDSILVGVSTSNGVEEVESPASSLASRAERESTPAQPSSRPVAGQTGPRGTDSS